MKNLVFITGVPSNVELYYEAYEKQFFKFTVNAYHNDHDDAILCVCNNSKIDVVNEAKLTGNTIDICGNIRARRNEDGSKTVYVFVADVASSLPFAEEENDAVGDAEVDKPPQVYANRTVVWIRLSISGGRFAYVPAVGYGNVAKRMAMFNVDDAFSYNGYVVSTEDCTTCQLVINDFNLKGEKKHENPQNYGAELQGTGTFRSVSEGCHEDMRRKPMWKNDSYRRGVRHSDREDVRRNYGRQYQTYGRSWQ